MCGLVGFSDRPNFARKCVPTLMRSLLAMSGRGHKGAGMVVYDINANHFDSYRNFGTASEVFGKNANNSKLNDLLGDEYNYTRGIAHIRYPTYGKVERNIYDLHPIFSNSDLGKFALAMNGNMENAEEYRKVLEKTMGFQGTTDTEVIVNLIVRSNAKTFRERLMEALDVITGAYSVLLITPTSIIAAKDRCEIRPLALGKMRDSGALVFASETCAFNVLGAELIKEMDPGEIIEVVGDKWESYPSIRETVNSPCSMETVYLMRPDSLWRGKPVSHWRRLLGQRLAREYPAKNKGYDYIVPVLDSGLCSAFGYALETGIILKPELFRGRDAGRIFMGETPEERSDGAEEKHFCSKDAFLNESIFLVDDSIWRGDTMKRVVSHLKDNGGAKEVHVGITCPEVVNPCNFGIASPDRSLLIASSTDRHDMALEFGAESVEFLSLRSYREILGPHACDNCQSGDEPKFVRRVA